MNTLVHCLDAWAARQPDALLFAFHDRRGEEVERYTYEEFALRSRKVAALLRARGLSTGQRALLMHPPGLELAVALIACCRVGAIATVAPVASPTGWRNPPMRKRLAAMVGDCTPSVALALESQVASIREHAPVPTELPLVATDAACLPEPSIRDEPDDILLLQYTSGSTSAPKGVIVTHANVIENARAVLDHPPVGVSWLPQFHDMGLIGYYLFPIVMGGCSHALAPFDFLRQPSLWLRMISRHRATFASAPNFGFDHCLRSGAIDDVEIEDVDLSSLKVLMNGAEPVRPETCRRFVERFRRHGLPPAAMVAAYGLAEATLAVTRGSARTLHFDADQMARGVAMPAASAVRRSVELASCGPALANVRLQIRSPRTGTACEEGLIGEICVAGASVTQGIWGRGDARPMDVPLRTGDLGFVLDGDLFVCGRASDLIVRHGQNFHPQDIEDAVDDEVGGARGCVAFQGEDGTIVVLVEMRPSKRLPDPLAIAARIAAAIGLAVDRVVIAPPRSIVRTTSGKLARLRTRRRLETGAIRPLVDALVPAGPGPADEDAVDWLRGLVARTPKLADAAIAEAGMDSLNLVRLQLELEERLRACVDDRTAAMLDGPSVQHWTCGEVLALADALHEGDGAKARRCARHLVRIATRAKADELDRMAADALLSLPAGPRRAASEGDAGEAILMTGATGFFGPFLLASLLAQTRRPIAIVARGRDDGHARERVCAALARAGLHAGAMADGFETRVTVWRGDLAAPLLGLTDARRDDIESRRYAIYHNAASVDYVRTYDALRPVNVLGTHALLSLAMTGAPKRLHYISSTFVFGWTKKGVLYETDSNKEMAGLDFGYSQSKWAAEQLVRRAGQAGLPVATYRPSLISVARSMHGDAHDVAARLLAFMIRYGVAVDTPNQISLLPADALAHNLVAISLRPSDTPATYHLTADRYHSLTALTRQITSDFGYRFQYLDIAAFIARLNALARPEDPIFPLLDFFNRAAPHIAAMSLKRYDNRRYRAARDAAPGSLSDPTLAELARRLILFLRNQRWIHAPAGDPEQGQTPPRSRSRQGARRPPSRRRNAA